MAPWVCGNDALAPNPGSLSDEDFIGSKAAIYVAVVVHNLLDVSNAQIFLYLCILCLLLIDLGFFV